ncbi:MAG TPA: uracil-DNA glycosylase [Polyangia bacterium]|nr:uracil-DNA glycosylase [Polyangia bacterium]
MAADVDDREELRSVVAQIRTNLASRGRSGLLGVPVRPTAKSGPPVAASPELPAVIEADDATSPRGQGALQVVRADLGDCQRCKLAPGRHNLVFGVGNPQADLVFVGEAPGADEDAQGEPFVGKAGQLLTKMIEAMGYARGDVYICNVLKCRPPGNRNPEPDEVAACEPFLKKQLGAIRPRMIVALGKFAVQCLLRDDSPISRLRGNLRTYEGIPLMPTFHPAYLLRDPSKKKLAWDDLKQVNAALARVGISPPNPSAG